MPASFNPDSRAFLYFASLRQRGRVVSASDSQSGRSGLESRSGDFGFVLGRPEFKSSATLVNCWFSHEVTKIQTTKLSILLRFYFHGVLEQLKTNFQTNFLLKRVLGFVTEYA